nr:transposase [Ktedonospora formicarum]
MPSTCAAVPGRKTDAKDAQWIADLLQHGLLKASFIPPQPQRDLRDLTRYRSSLKQERTRHVNRLHTLLEETNIKLSSIFADMMCKTGRDILHAPLRWGDETRGVGRSGAATYPKQTRCSSSCLARMHANPPLLPVGGTALDG